MKAKIMRAANALCNMLAECPDDDFVDMVCACVACNDWFTDEEIANAEAAECEHEFVYDELHDRTVCEKCGHVLTAEEKHAALEYANALRRAEEADADV